MERYSKAYDDKLRRKSKSVLRTIPKKFEYSKMSNSRNQYSGTDLKQLENTRNYITNSPPAGVNNTKGASFGPKQV